jgi:riboflavin kinase/FMN adenylyltransferase
LRIARSAAEAAGFGPSAVTIGNFDGVHIGHRHLLRSVCEAGKAMGAKPTVLTFDPHPSKVVAPQRTPRLLTTVDERCALMEAEGIEQILVLPFTLEIARLSPAEFVREILVNALGTKLVMVGENFRFGHKQSGDTKALTELGSRYGFEVRLAGVEACRGEVVSSSAVRKFVDAGEVGRAWRFLGRPYSLAGEVVQGRGVGSKQTVPTLNLKTSAEVLPRVGVYVTGTSAAEAARGMNRAVRWKSITNVGYRPTFEDSEVQLSIETFLLDGPGEPGGSPQSWSSAPQKIEVEFLHRVRDEKKFESPEALKAQIFRDVGRAKRFFQLWKGIE